MAGDETSLSRTQKTKTSKNKQQKCTSMIQISTYFSKYRYSLFQALKDGVHHAEIAGHRG
jgi:hypothetical protein